MQLVTLRCFHIPETKQLLRAAHTLNNVSDFYIQWFSHVLAFGMSALLKLPKILLY